jgi:hypothetical protein
MTALEFKTQYVKPEEVDKFSVIGHLSSVVAGQRDSWYHIHDNEQIPDNVGISLHLRSEYLDHWRDEVGLDEPALHQNIGA